MSKAMDQIAPAGAKPQLVIGDVDHRNLVSLALAMEKGLPDVSEALLDELDRARVVSQVNVPEHTVRMGSTVRFAIKGAGERQVVLVLPGEADIDAGRISVMTPIGAALIGLSTGQSIRWHTRDGREQELTVREVAPPVEVG
jgi:regulator of nucleoside diphosphate kinase